MHNNAGLRRNCNFLKKPCVAFTMAEVLITLGIIGIIAAMTLPSLIQRQQNMVNVTTLKKFYTVFSQGINLMKSQTGCEDVACLGFVGEVSDEDWNNQMESKMKKLFNITKMCKYGNNACTTPIYQLSGVVQENGFSKTNFSFMTADGIKIKIMPKTEGAEWNSITVDVNGDKKPNTIGRDIFLFRMDNKGLIHPYYGLVYSNGNRHMYWKTNEMLCGWPGKKVPANSTGYGCTARVIEENWTMTY